MRKLISYGSNPGKIDSLVKVDKLGNPVRPVVSMMGTPKYQFTKFLDSMIKLYIPQTFMLQSTNQFIELLNEFKFNSNPKLVRFEVSSLFTNVPLNETIQVRADTVYNSEQPNTNQPIFEKRIFIKLLRLATKGIFMHKNKFYQQHDEVNMGSPVGTSYCEFLSRTHGK